MITLSPAQRDAVNFFERHPRAILADAPGVGKTFPAIDAAAWAPPSDAPVLVVVPAYLMTQWAREIERYGARGPITIVRQADPPPEMRGWVICNYHMLMNAGVRKHPELLRQRWRAVIFDEAHRLRGRNSQWTKNAYQLNADRVWMLTGTPVVNNPGDLYPLLRLCNPKDFRSYWKFVNEWCETEVTPFATNVHGLRPGVERRFHDMLDAYLLRRRFEDIAENAGGLTLPPRLPDRHIPVPLPPSLKKAHDKAKKEWFIEHPNLDEPIVAASGGALIARLRQLTSGFLIPVDEQTDPDAPSLTPKLDACVDFLSDRPNEPVIVFTYFKATARLLAQKIDAAGRTAFVATGDLDPVRRSVAVDFWKQSKNGVLVATIAALQEGANLQNASTVCFVEHSYLPTDMEQAVARVRRVGQTRPVSVVHFLCEKTVDEAVLRVAGRRERNIVRALLTDLQEPDSKLLAQTA